MKEIIEYAKSELSKSGWVNEYGECINDEYILQVRICRRLIEMFQFMENTNNQVEGIDILLDFVDRLTNLKPITPLTGEDDEWEEISTGNYQNKRCKSVFKTNETVKGQAFDLEHTIFWKWTTDSLGKKEKNFFITYDSTAPVTFPYMPKKEYVEVTSR